MNERRFDRAATAVAAIFLAFAGVLVWRSSGPPTRTPREVRVAWQCADTKQDAGTCSATSELERCTTCHDDKAHTERNVLVVKHEGIGCVACHGGEGLAREETPAHEALVARPFVQARCGACHEASVSLAPVLDAGRRAFASLRCGACHAASESSPVATPLDVLGLRATRSQIARALANHRASASVDLALDDDARTAVASHLAAIAQPDAEGAMLHRASVPGSSAEEGHTLYARLACAQCHDSKHDDLSAIATTRTADWVAYFLSSPSHANPAATMPSLRLSAREASSLAADLVHVRVTADPIDVRVKKLGESIVAEKKCVACHAATFESTGPTLAHFGESHDGAATLAKLQNHAGFVIDDETKRALATYLVSQRDARVRPDLRVARDEGAELYASLGCERCHSLDDVNACAPGPSLFGEGLRVKPQWLFEYLRAPQSHPVRPPFHPEWAFRDLVPADRVTVRMPTYTLSEERVTSLVRFFAKRDGASYPFAASTPATLSGESLASAISDLTHKDRGACTTCHTIAIPDLSRAQQDLDKLAPPLSLAHDRLRPAWIDACILQAPKWVAGMPAFPRPDEVPHLRDLILLLRDRTILPAPGAETTVPALGLGDLP